MEIKTNEEGTKKRKVEIKDDTKVELSTFEQGKKYLMELKINDAVECFKKDGSADAMAYVCYCRYRVCPRPEQAEELIFLHEKKGSLLACAFYHDIIRGESKQALLYYKAILKDKIDPFIEYQIGILYLFNLNDRAEAFHYLELSAKHGFFEAQARVGHLYFHGTGVAVDYKKAIEYWELASRLDLMSLFNIGECYYFGHGVNENKIKAIEIFETCSQKGLIDATYRLGMFYKDGLNVSKDETKALEYFKKGAAFDHLDCLFAIRELYEVGSNKIKKDDTKALALQKRYRKLTTLTP